MVTNYKSNPDRGSNADIVNNNSLSKSAMQF